MEELRNALHAAAADPPPTGIDLDELITGTRRRTRLRYALGTTVGALAMVVGAVAAPTVLAPSGGLGAGGPGAPPVCPQVTPTTTARPDRTGEPGLPDEPCGTAAGRLTGALDASLRTVLPGWTATNDEHPSGPVRFARQAPDAAPDGYLADVDVRRGTQFHIVLVQVSVHGYARTAGERGGIEPVMVCQQQTFGPADTCQVHTEADGEVLVTGTVPTLAGSSAGLGGYWVTDLRPDGTCVTVLGSQALTLDRITRIARTPGLTLFP